MLLDEPTNHLDIGTTEWLEAYLARCSQAMIIVSHDRYFLDRVAQRLFVLNPPDMVDFSGNFSKWHQKQRANAQAEPRAQTTHERSSGKREQASRSAAPSHARSDSVAKKPKSADNPYLRPFGRLTMKELEAQITETEVALAECQQAFADSESFKDPARANRLRGEYEALGKKLKQLEAEYFAREQ
jgi:ATPase subunit of ABC transporter with duplicated ATPase domains